jgi:hypothetical protein
MEPLFFLAGALLVALPRALSLFLALLLLRICWPIAER